MKLVCLIVSLLAVQVQSQNVFVNSYVFASPSSLNTGLVSYWALEQASGTRFDGEPTVNVMDLTDNNTVTNVVGKVGNAAFFIRANGEFLSHTDSPELSRGNFDWTIIAWTKATTLASDMVIASQWSVTPSQQRSWRMWFNSGSGKYAFDVSDNGINDVSLLDTNFGTPATNAWHFHLISHDSVNNLISISTNNGTPNTLGHATGILDSNATFDIGARGTAGADFWDGAIDEVGIWDRLLTPTEITYLYNGAAGRTCCPIP